MSKRKATKVYMVEIPSGRGFYVIARHAKGAVTIARANGLGKGAKATEVDKSKAHEAINYKAKDEAHG
tara:strand:+ start:7893 stop:8096 length:204 start_codon:yes stop_codon:yes gene_type:complete